MASMTVKRDLFKNCERKCLHIELDITGSRLRYEAGDHVAVYPTNDSDIVDRIGQLLNVDLDAVFSLVNIEGTANFFNYVIKLR